MNENQPSKKRARRGRDTWRHQPRATLVDVGARRTLLVRLVIGGSVLACGVGAVLCADLAGPGMVLRADTRQDQLVGVIFSVILLACFVGALLYPRRYVLQMTRDRDQLTIRCLGYGVPRIHRLVVADVRFTREYDNRGSSMRDAPFTVLHTDHGAFLLDHRSDLIDLAAIRRLPHPG